VKRRKQKDLAKRGLSQRWLFWSAFILAIFPFFLLGKAHLTCPDGAGYFVYTRSLVIDRDFHFENDLKLLCVAPKEGWFVPTERGYISSPFAIGTSIAWLPFFAIIHSVLLILKFILKLPFITDGTSYLHILTCSLASCLFALFGLFISCKLSRRFFSSEESILSMFTVWLSSPFFFCFYWMPTFSHLLDVFAISLFLFMWTRKDKDRYLWWLLYGASFGLCALIRWQNAVLIILLFIPPRLTPKQFFFLIGALLSFSPQLIVWKIVYGSFFLIPQGESYMVWSRPEIAKFLFSSWHGLYSWTPVTLLSTIGLFLLYRKERAFSVGLILTFLIYIYVNSCVSDWWAGTSFSARRMTGLTPLFIVGLSCFLSLFRKRLFKYLIATALSFSAIVLALSMLNAPDYLTEYRSYSELIRLWFSTLCNIKDQFSFFSVWSPLMMLNECRDDRLGFSVAAIIYTILGMLFFFSLKAGYNLIKPLKST
jgi:hypothetical protein